MRTTTRQGRRQVAHVAVMALGLLLGTFGFGSSASASPRAEATTDQVVLGSSAFGLGSGWGFGTVAPTSIYNGGDASGLVKQIHWQSWGQAEAIGFGRNPTFRPHGGYYKKLLGIELMAGNIGSCPDGTGPAYTTLQFRARRKPGGKLGPWRNWSGQPTICAWAY
jgi:hypothetical protein